MGTDDLRDAIIPEGNWKYFASEDVLGASSKFWLNTLDPRKGC
jgi:hypothetical protein